MTDEILPIPQIPDGLREASQRGTLIPFIGAGASRLAGCPGWPEFAHSTLRYFIEKGKLTHAQLAQISHLNPRVKLSLALELEEVHKIQIDFRKLLQTSDPRSIERGQQLYGSLSKLGKTFVTTNYDEWLDTKIVSPSLLTKSGAASAMPEISNPRTVIYKVSDLIPANLNSPDIVIHLHGSVRDPESMILTTQHYLLHYANDRFFGDPNKENRVLSFLEYLFKEKTVLFVGYGLEELEILEYVILKARQLPGTCNAEARHFILQGFFSHEQELVGNLSRYYLRQCGIELIPFLRDQKDWDQLLDVLEDFALHIPASDVMYQQDFKEMEDLLNG